jgi:DNA-binding winged helix-turn-helix (wHTH) protein
VSQGDRMSVAAGRQIESTRIRISAAQRALWVDGQPAIVGARAFDLLLALVERRDRVVGKNELLEVVWPKLVVEDSNLHVQISTLRKLLGPSCIATIPGRGYRFTAPIEGVECTVASTLAPTPPDLLAIAVELKTNLPESLPPLIGRADDLASLDGLIAGHRLVTITGAGGMGKTRVAMQLLHDRRRAFEHGVSWWSARSPARWDCRCRATTR